MGWRAIWVACVLLGSSITAFAQEEPPYTRTRDVVYGRKFGVALTMDVFTPKKPNGAAVIFCVSGGWVSSYEAIDGVETFFLKPFMDRGYTVFAVMHGCQPKFTLPEIIEDMNRSVRFIRANAKKFQIDPERIGITGGSAGGHLSLMIGLGGTPGDPSAKDPVMRESSRVQAVGCFYPPTDFRNYGKPGIEAIGNPTLAGYQAPFDFHKFDSAQRRYIRVLDWREISKIATEVSPITHVSEDDPPVLLVHGDADKLVPIQQSEVLIDKLKAAKIPNKLIVKKGAAHGWPTMVVEVVEIAKWFDEHLKPKESKASDNASQK
ncbi:alpha/beta hydrolase [Tuwongella immobilis]|uniref:BD-FAE-like domain-containing protein n=1 Tax=Tuwongella immobilis TaxID=692036 RepID=A0A6C2YI99_9BACT|nr:alpha/beta hydrolase [Tuwongella immobilis]VIP00989.1 Esterase/lipase OS=Singulisphaera acidiphila (strain ATCC BAA-1392 / DSM 18658 / VKM B-2454 / MOB10) GN=Sinac_3469 PE=4 SV=1: Abhydrolase_3 [Tuwongella immobilis]VTR97401.1 Esterase/lipase OS=Singulisphaera acidiphila (strain ATCC BAA-1392 / DSM 18658 / VKM B-2454 / MOB10) GN=Sinac_3469 PE=4 SV=1: Abhydrolase_3 [Tuwongella immobilis]